MRIFARPKKTHEPRTRCTYLCISQKFSQILGNKHKFQLYHHKFLDLNKCHPQGSQILKKQKPKICKKINNIHLIQFRYYLNNQTHVFQLHKNTLQRSDHTGHVHYKEYHHQGMEFLKKTTFHSISHLYL